MIRYSRYVEPDVPPQRIAPKSQSQKPRNVVAVPMQAAAESSPSSVTTDTQQQAVENLMAGEQLELTAPDNPRPKAKKTKPAMRKPKILPDDSSTTPALPLLATF